MINVMDSWQNWIVLLIVLAIGVSFTLLQIKFKFLQKVPKPMLMILIGALLVGGGAYGTGILGPENWGLVGWFGLLSGVVLLFFAGYEINTDELKQFGVPAILMGTLPSIFEGFLLGTIMLPMMGWFNPAGVDLASQWPFAYAMGFALAAATPGIIIPMLNKFKNNSYSKHNKLNEIIIIGASIDDVTALSFFVVFISMASPAGEVGIGTIIAQVPVKLIWSSIVGMSFAFFVAAITIPVRRNVAKKEATIVLTAIIFIMSIGLLELGQFLEHKSASMPNLAWINFEFYLAAIAAGLTSSFLLKNKAVNDKETDVAHAISKPIQMFWLFFGSAAVFASAGTNITFEIFANAKIYAFIPIIFLGLFVGRFAGISLSLYDKDKFKWNDKVFATAAYIPKGTATAAAILLVQTKLGADSPLNVYVETMLLPAALMAIVATIPIAEFAVKELHSRLQFVTSAGQTPPEIKFKDAFGKRK